MLHTCRNPFASLLKNIEDKIPIKALYNVRNMLGLGQQRIVSGESASYGFIGKAEIASFSTESSVLYNAQVFIWVNRWIA